MTSKSLQLLASLGCLVALVTCGRADEQCEGPCCAGACDPCRDGRCDDKDALGWEPPVLLWWGDAGAPAPGCPAWAPEVVFEGVDGLSAKQECPSCSCGPAACKLPAGMVVWNEFMCNAHDVPDPEFIPYLAPDPWDGSCVTRETIPKDTFRSLQFLSTTLSPCSPITGPEPVVAEPVWETQARACGAGKIAPEDERPPEAPLTPAGFKECLWRQGEPGPCPADHPDRRMFYREIETSLTCTACTCGEPTDASCIALVRLFLRPECDMTPGQWSGMAMDLVRSPCTGTLGGTMSLSIGSMNAMWYEQQPGRCEPAGSEPIGEVWANEQTTFCCAEAR
ncbi:hypothetical protein [Chondromyces crocatus]|uniref:Uncharacterized protein n=1 Tax=Chondromyces crocatus TaxID=52 RepID=A0A0K1EIZ9_CHOCO|nr:hypothetical protein [Chondromyces crocatus]AKT40642.1 uncharacterized protein CMC5_047980 [Chondromyces crocatus]